MEHDLPWLILRKDGECAGECQQSRTERLAISGEVTHGLTETTDGRLVGELEIEAKLAQQHPEGSSASIQLDLDSVAAFNQLPVNTRIHRCKRANTIDFAQREKDEMRDLTRASEILTVWGTEDKDLQAVCRFPLSSLS